MANRAENIEKLKGELQEEINSYFEETGRHNSVTLDRDGAYSIRSTFKRISRGKQAKKQGGNMDPKIAGDIIDKLDRLIDLLDSQAENNSRGVSYGGRRRRTSKTHRRRSHKRKSRRLRRSHSRS